MQHDWFNAMQSEIRRAIEAKGRPDRIDQARSVLGHWLLKLSAETHRIGIAVLPTLEGIELSTGDYLTRLGQLIGIERELDAPFRERLLNRFKHPN